MTNNLLTKNRLSELIKEHNPTQLVIKFTDFDGSWKSISFSAKNFDYQIINGLQIEGYNLKPLSDERYFIDPFLAHKTITFITDLQNMQLIKDNSFNNPYITLPFTCFFNEYMEQSGTILSDASIDQLIDIKGELLQALEQINVQIKIHYLIEQTSQSNHSVIMIKSHTRTIENLDNIQKSKYALQMITKVYKIELDPQSSILTLCSKLIV